MEGPAELAIAAANGLPRRQAVRLLGMIVAGHDLTYLLRRYRVCAWWRDCQRL